MFDILQEILQSYLFPVSQKFKMLSCQWYRIKQIKSIFGDKGNRALLLRKIVLITSACEHARSKLVLKLHLLACLHANKYSLIPVCLQVNCDVIGLRHSLLFK